jgi:HEAT repeat protein
MLRAVVIASSGFACIAAAPPTQPLSLDAAFKQMADYQFGSPTLPLETISRAVTEAAKDPSKREAMAARLTGLLDIQYMPETRLFAVRELVKVAGPKQVPVLAELLDSEKLSPAALHLLVQLNHPDADAAVRDAIPIMGMLPRYGAIAALGERRDARAMDLLRQMICDCDPEVLAVILPTLARIDTPEAVKMIHDKLELEDESVRLAAQDAYLLVADDLLAKGEKARAGEMYEEVHNLGKVLPGPKVASLRGLFLAAPDRAKPLAEALLKSDDRARHADAEHLLRTMRKE